MEINKIVKKFNKLTNNFVPDIAIVLGSGLGGACPEIKDVKTVSYVDLGMPASIVKGHSGKFICGTTKEGKKIIVVSRYHFYEKGDVSLVRLPYDILNAIGCKKIIITTACGGINPKLDSGNIVAITDHINFAIDPILALKNQYFVSVDEIYSKSFIKNFENIANKNKIKTTKGVFAQRTGPCYETPAEIKMLLTCGVDVVSMSTAMDATYCKFLQFDILGLAIVSNKAGEKVDHELVLKEMNKAGENLKIMLTEFVKII